MMLALRIDRDTSSNGEVDGRVPFTLCGANHFRVGLAIAFPFRGSLSSSPRDMFAWTRRAQSSAG
jgi:hypothetical protein